MKVLVAGSLHFENSNDVRASFVEACNEIGVALAQAGHELVVGSGSDNTADKHIFNGFISVKNHPRLYIIRPLGVKHDDKKKEGDILFAKLPQKLRVDRHPADSWSKIRVYQVLEADVVLVLGGSAAGTALIAGTATALQRPVLAIPSFGGASQKIWSDLKRDFQGVSSSLENLYNYLGQSWNLGDSKYVVSALEKLKRENPYRRNAAVNSSIILIWTILLLVIWLILLGSTPLKPLYNFFALLALSVMLGVNLRASLGHLLNPGINLSWATVLIEFSIGMVVAFGLALFYLIGGFIVTGSWNPDDFLKVSDLTRVGVIMSIIGLASGFLLEVAIERLRELLMDIVKVKKPGNDDATV